VPSPYEAILASLESLPWRSVPEVTPIRPLARKNIDFFPGQAGHTGPSFPVGGVMMVGNNFSSVKGWNDYATGADEQSTTATWRKLRVMIEASGVPWDDFWFTNYCLGAMERSRESYDFPHRVVKALKFETMFERSVAEMRPRLIVSLARAAAKHLRTDYERRERLDEKDLGGHATRLLAAVHPSAWTWRRKAFGLEEFINEGRRIGAAASLERMDDRTSQ
jgi:hypothetical protein